MSDSLDPYHWLLGIAPEEQPPDHYRLLGIERLELNSDVIVNAAQRQLDHLRRFFSGEDREHASSLCNEVTRARDCLLDHESHRFYAAQLQGVDSQPADLAAKADWREFASEFDRAWRVAQALEFDPQHHWLGIPLHQRPASNFRLLGLSDQVHHGDVIRGAAERQISFVRKFASGEQAEAANDLLRQLSRARAALLRSIKPNNQNHAEANLHSPAAVPTPRVPESDGVPLAAEPDLADLDTSDWEVPVPMAPQPSVPVVAVEMPQQPKWILALVASTVVGLSVIGLMLGSAGYIGYSRRSVHRERHMAEAMDQLEAPLERDNSSAEPADPGPEDLESVIENEQTVAALQQLAAFRIQMHEIQARMDQQATTTEDHQKVSSLIEKLGKFGTEFPRRRSTVDGQAETLKLSALLMLENMQDLRRKMAAAERESMDVPEPESMTTVEPEPMHVVEPESTNRPPPTPDDDAQPSNQRPLFFSRARDWTLAQGTSFSAIVVEVDEDRVVFKSPGNGREATMPLEQLIPADVSVLRLAFFGDQENQQLERTRTYVNQIASAPLASANSLKQSHRGSRTGPYAGLWASVCMSTGENRHAEAASILRQVISRLELQRKVDSNRHAMTLTSALNNLAVCTIKDHQGDKAAGYFVASLETMPLSSTIVLHNARQLKELSSQPETPLALRSSSRRNLDQALNQHSVDQESLPSGWHYSLDVDLPRYAFAPNAVGNRYLSEHSGTAGGSSSLTVKDTWCITCKGLGSIPCKYGKCNKGTIVVQQRVQVAVNPLNGDPIYGNKGFKQSCPSCGGRGGFDCPHCEGGRL